MKGLDSNRSPAHIFISYSLVYAGYVWLLFTGLYMSLIDSAQILTV